MFIRENKFFTAALVALIIFGALTFGNMPGPATQTGVVSVDGTVYNFSDYPALTQEQLGIFNYLDGLVTGQPYGSWEGWYAESFPSLLHYVLAFIMYATSLIFETTPGYRTTHYQDFSWSLLQKMNTSYDEYNITSIEYTEWINTPFPDYYYDADDPYNASNTDAVYTGGFRGPANIMWTGHYGLMEALHERNFNTGAAFEELSWFIRDWNNTLTTDGKGNQKDGGLWGIGLIPCEPYIAFVNCNSIPMFATYLYDNMYGTDYKGVWDFGLNFSNVVAQDEYGLFTDGYYVQQPLGYQQLPDGPQQPFPGNSIDRSVSGGPVRVSGYITAWALTFLEYIQPQETTNDYPLFLDVYGRDVSGDKFVVVENHRHPNAFGTFDILATLFTLPLSNQRGDLVTNQRIRNFIHGVFDKVWSSDGRAMWFDTMSLVPFLQAPLSTAWVWGTTPTYIRDFAEARPAAFWDQPYISAADDDRIWVYQAAWDEDKGAFILNIRVDQAASLTFSNFDSAPTAHVAGGSLGELTEAGPDYTLSLEPGLYQIVLR